MGRGRAVLALSLLASPPAAAQSWDIPAYQFFPGNAELDIAALAGGTAFSVSGSHSLGASGAGAGQTVSGVAKLMPRLHRDFDSGLSVGLDATLTATTHGELSRATRDLPDLTLLPAWASRGAAGATARRTRSCGRLPEPSAVPYRR